MTAMTVPIQKSMANLPTAGEPHPDADSQQQVDQTPEPVICERSPNHANTVLAICHFDYGTVTAVQVVPAQTYSVVLAPPSVLIQSEPLPLGDVPHVVDGAPV